LEIEVLDGADLLKQPWTVIILRKVQLDIVLKELLPDVPDLPAGEVLSLRSSVPSSFDLASSSVPVADGSSRLISSVDNQHFVGV